MWRRGCDVSTREEGRSPLHCVSGAPACNMHPAYCRSAGAGEGNRTLVVSLEGLCSTIELHPLVEAAMPLAEQRRQPLRTVDVSQVAALPRTTHDESGRHRCNLDRSPLVAFGDACGAMARLID